ncbi:MAG: cupin domain-containing protein [Pseudomonadota bacterium]
MSRQPNPHSTSYWIEQLGLARHPEGGWFRESYRSAELIPASALPDRFDEQRCFSTAIYFLLEEGDISALHRLKSDEIWHFYDGASLAVHVIEPDGKHYTLLLGHDLDGGEQLQAIVPAGCWFGAELAGSGEHALVGCSVAPGFDFNDFEMASGEELIALFPQHEGLISRMTRG